jgi:cell division protease FtsH
MAPNANDRPPAPTPPAAARRNAALVPGGWAALVLIGLVILFLFMVNTTKRITYTEFRELAEAGQIKVLRVIGTDQAKGEVRDPKGPLAERLKLTNGEFAVTLLATDDQTRWAKEIEAADDARRPAGSERVQIVRSEDQLALLGPFVWTFLPLILFAAFFALYLLPRLREGPGGGGFLNSYIRSPAKRYEKGKGKITFDEVAGMETAKRELSEIVEFLKNPEKFTRLGAQVPKGVLLVGPPGTGKTLLAKAVAGEANVPFYSINGSEFIQMFVGVGASRVRDLFKTAKENAPCVIFIDEIDAVGRMRGAGVGGGSDEREQTLNQILSEMDGFQPSETVIVMAATNRPDVLDAALLRPGRFDRHVTVDRPTWQGRLAILKVHTRNKPLADDLDLERVARNMIGMSGAELRNLCNEAALIATREGKNRIDQSDFDAAGDRVRLGLKREEMFGAEEKRRTAYHEAGHALCAWLEPKAHKLDRVSIVPRGRSGGVTLFQPDEDRVDRSYHEFMADLVVLLGGRAADKLVIGEPLSGAVQDIKMATRTARQMVTQYGMSDRLGPVHFRFAEEHVFLGKEMHEGRDFSEGTARIIDEEIQRIVSEALARSEELLRSNRANLDRLADALMMHEELDRDEIGQVMAGVPLADLRPKPPAAATAGPTPVPQPMPESSPPPGLAFGGA